MLRHRDSRIHANLVDPCGKVPENLQQCWSCCFRSHRCANVLFANPGCWAPNSLCCRTEDSTTWSSGLFCPVASLDCPGCATDLCRTIEICMNPCYLNMYSQIGHLDCMSASVCCPLCCVEPCLGSDDYRQLRRKEEVGITGEEPDCFITFCCLPLWPSLVNAQLFREMRVKKVLPWDHPGREVSYSIKAPAKVEPAAQDQAKIPGGKMIRIFHEKTVQELADKYQTEHEAEAMMLHTEELKAMERAAAGLPLSPTAAPDGGGPTSRPNSASGHPHKVAPHMARRLLGGDPAPPPKQP